MCWKMAGCWSRAITTNCWRVAGFMPACAVCNSATMWTSRQPQPSRRLRALFAPENFVDQDIGPAVGLEFLLHRLRVVVGFRPQDEIDRIFRIALLVGLEEIIEDSGLGLPEVAIFGVQLRR